MHWETHLHSIIATVMIIAFAIPFLLRDYRFTSDDNIYECFFWYSMIIGVMVGLFSHVLLGIWFSDNAVEITGFSVAIAVLTMAVLYFYETPDDEKIFEFFWEEYPQYQSKMLVWMAVVLSVPFIGIFAIQSNFLYGFICFYCTAALAIVVNLLYDTVSEMKKPGVGKYVDPDEQQ